ncbi:MAG: redox-sensing transcriptional repressor Rex [Candidatus Borkfalkiaceae bacterium]|nr:redox-sensing transcriptional repressor Rex [Christensenellaceae bacterium]
MSNRKIPESVMARLPVYLHFLKSFPAQEGDTISSAAIAKNLGLGEVQVRKDLALISGAGKPKIGYYRLELVSHIESALGSGKNTNAVIVGAGKLGRALLCYEGFSEFGVHILAAFDVEVENGLKISGDKRVLPVSELFKFCKENDVKIGVITVPESQAQTVADELVKAKVSAIWNFAPARLKIPPEIKVKNENMAASVAVLSASL